MKTLRSLFQLAIWAALCVQPAAADLLLFPYGANQRGFVACLELPSLNYEVYMPPAYSTNGPPLPILYTYRPSGGGMVTQFRAVCSNLNIILVGVVGPANTNTNVVYRESYAVARDIRRRVLFDPTAEFAAGFSGGGLNSYRFSRMRAQHVSGVFAMAGWLGVSNINPYKPVDGVQTNLLVARATGNSDTSAIFYNSLDGPFLNSCGAVVQDWFFDGGHVVAPDSVKLECLSWLVANRVPAGATDRADAATLAAGWRAQMNAGQHETVLRECVAMLMARPRSWFAYQAQLILDDLLSRYTLFRSLNMEALASGDFAQEMFFYTMHGASQAGDMNRYHSALKALTGCTPVLIDRVPDIRQFLATFGFPVPRPEMIPGATADTLSVLLRKDTPGLMYSLESRAQMEAGVWQPAAVSPQETNTTWRASVPAGPGVDAGYHRLNATLP
jgi:hypothetical protein